MLVEVVQDDLRLGVALQLHDDAHVGLRLVADVADALDHLVLHELGRVLDHLRLVHLVGERGDDDALAVALPRLDLGGAAHAELAAPARVHGGDAVAAADLRARGEVRSFHELHQVVDRAVAVVDVVGDAVAELAEVVRRNVGGHANGDAGGAVEEEVRELRGEDGGLVQRLVEVLHHVHGVLLQVTEHLLGDALHADLRVAHRRGAVAVDGPEVAVAVHERHAQGERLGHADDRVVHRRVAVRVVLADHVAHDARALEVLLVPRVVEHVHGVEAAPVHGLEAVAHVGERAPHDHAHRVVDVVAAHLLFDGHVLQHAGDRRRGRLSGFVLVLFFVAHVARFPFVFGDDIISHPTAK